MAENYIVGVPAAWQQQQENRRSRGAPAEAKFGEGAVHLAAQGAEWTARRPAGAHSLWAGFTGSGEPVIAFAAAAWFTGGPRSWQASSGSSGDFESTFIKVVHGVQCHASGNDCVQTRTNIRGINC